MELIHLLDVAVEGLLLHGMHGSLPRWFCGVEGLPHHSMIRDTMIVLQAQPEPQPSLRKRKGVSIGRTAQAQEGCYSSEACRTEVLLLYCYSVIIVPL
jgi:hypothetical protein